METRTPAKQRGKNGYASTLLQRTDASRMEGIGSAPRRTDASRMEGIGAPFG